MESKEQAILALEGAKKDGVRAIVSTPHFIPGKQDRKDVEAMSSRMEELKDLARDYGIEVYFGSEIFLNDDYLEMLDNEWFYTLAGSGYALCEFDVRKNIIDFGDEPDDKLYEFTVRNMIPVIAHAEDIFIKEYR